jgi:hypothetical protein
MCKRLFIALHVLPSDIKHRFLLVNSAPVFVGDEYKLGPEISCSDREFSVPYAVLSAHLFRDTVIESFSIQNLLH